MNHENQEPQQPSPGVPDRSRQPDRPQGRDYVSPRSADDAATAASPGFPTGLPVNGLAVPPEFQIQLNHQQVTQNFPDPETSKALREKAPEVYDAWINTTVDSISADNHVRRAQVDNPRKISNVGQISGVIVVLSVLALAAYAVHENQPWLAGFLCTIDLVLLAGVFANPGKTPPQQPPAQS